MSNQLKAIHDRLMADKPDEIEHDPAGCVFCIAALDTDPKNQPPGGPDMGDFTQAQVDELVEAAKAEAKKTTDALQARLDELEAASKDTEVGKAVAEAVAPLQTSISELQSKLDAAEAAKTTADANLADALAFLEAEQTAQVEAAAVAERKDARLAEAAELKTKGGAPVFDEKYLAENADRFAAMDDEAWASRLDEWKLIASANPAAAPATPPGKTAFQASRQTTDPANGSSLHLISEMRRDGQDPRRIA